MSDLHGLPLVRRVFGEHRRTVLPLVAGLVLNVVVFAALVYPLSQRVANVEQREQTAAQALAAAQREHAQAAGTLTGKDRAATELTTFYRSVLPGDIAAARRLVYLRLLQLARESGLRFVREGLATTVPRNSTLTQLRVEMELRGPYSGMRAFIYQLETAPEFVVIDNIALSEGEDGEGDLSVNLSLSTYFRTMP